VTTVFRIVRYLLEVNVGQQTVKEFTYDSAGRTTAVETSAGTTSLSYDYESRVTGITYPNQSTNSFTYNGLDTRVGMSDSGGSKSFLRDGVSVTSPVLSDGSATYTPAISERRSSTTTFYHAGIKNGDSQSSTGQSITASVQYDAFGNVTSSSGTWQGPFAYGGPYGYQEDPDSGLKLLGHRYYDPSTGRFLTRDPIKDGRNWYGYCGNNSTKFADPSGLWWWPQPWQGDVENRSNNDVIVIGEPAFACPQIAVLLRPGQQDPPNFDSDDLGIPREDGTYRWYHLEIHFPYFSSADVIVGEGAALRLRNGFTSRLVPIVEGSAEHGRIERIINGGLWPIGIPIPPDPPPHIPPNLFPPVGSFRKPDGSLVWH